MIGNNLFVFVKVYSLDCADINHKDFSVLPPDPHNLDGDNDGIGRES